LVFSFEDDEDCGAEEDELFCSCFWELEELSESLWLLDDNVEVQEVTIEPQDVA
jgi:hypothetical protein